MGNDQQGDQEQHLTSTMYVLAWLLRLQCCMHNVSVSLSVSYNLRYRVCGNKMHGPPAK